MKKRRASATRCVGLSERTPDARYSRTERRATPPGIPYACRERLAPLIPNVTSSGQHPPADANATRRQDPGTRRPRSDADVTICAVFEPRRLRAVADVTICAILKAPGPLGRVLRAPPRMRILGFCRERPHAAPSPPVKTSHFVTSASRGRPRSPRTAQTVTSATGHPAGRVAEPPARAARDCAAGVLTQVVPRPGDSSRSRAVRSAVSLPAAPAASSLRPLRSPAALLPSHLDNKKRTGSLAKRPCPQGGKATALRAD